MSTIFADANAEDKRTFFEAGIFCTTKKNIVLLLDKIEMSDFRVSLDELKEFPLNVSNMHCINETIGDFFYECLQSCNNSIDDEKCCFISLNDTYTRVTHNIEQSDASLEDKKSSHCIVLIAYLIAGQKYRMISYLWKDRNEIQ